MISVNMEKAKAMSHEWRRAKRAEEFAPHDEVIMKQIPNADSVAVEEARQSIRAKYEVIQSNIDAANDANTLKAILVENSIV